MMRNTDWVNDHILHPRVEQFRSRGHWFKVRGERFQRINILTHTSNEQAGEAVAVGIIMEFERYMETKGF